MICEKVRIWKEVVATYLEVLSRHSTGDVEENHGNLQSGYPLTRPRFEPRILKIQVCGVTAILSWSVRIVETGFFHLTVKTSVLSSDFQTGRNRRNIVIDCSSLFGCFTTFYHLLNLCTDELNMLG
jgi:hypothetical protein